MRRLPRRSQFGEGGAQRPQATARRASYFSHPRQSHTIAGPLVPLSYAIPIPPSPMLRRASASTWGAEVSTKATEKDQREDSNLRPTPAH